MNTAKIVIKSEDSKKIYEAIIPEISSKESERSTVKLKAVKDELIVDFEAKDINALKVVINHILRLITAFNDSEKITGKEA